MKSYQRTPAAHLTDAEIARVWQLAQAFTPDWEIAHYLDFTTATWKAYKAINPGIQDLINKAKAYGATSLREAQMESALRGNIQMQIWLGRSILGQNQDVHMQATGQPVQITDVSPEAKQRLLELRDSIYRKESEKITVVEAEVVDLTSVEKSDHPGTVGAAGAQSNESSDSV